MHSIKSYQEAAPKKKEKLFLAGLRITAFNLRKIAGLDFNREI